MSESIGTTTTLYPCDKGQPGNVGGRGWHDFRVTEHGTCCRLCGAAPRIPRPSNPAGAFTPPSAETAHWMIHLAGTDAAGGAR